MGEPHAIVLHGDDGQAASGEWCDTCWPLVEARLYVLCGLSYDA